MSERLETMEKSEKSERLCECLKRLVASGFKPTEERDIQVMKCTEKGQVIADREGLTTPVFVMAIR